MNHSYWIILKFLTPRLLCHWCLYQGLFFTPPPPPRTMGKTNWGEVTSSWGWNSLVYGSGGKATCFETKLVCRSQPAAMVDGGLKKIVLDLWSQTSRVEFHTNHLTHGIYGTSGHSKHFSPTTIHKVGFLSRPDVPSYNRDQLWSSLEESLWQCMVTRLLFSSFQKPM